MRYLLLSCFCLLTLFGFTQEENLIKLRYWNGTTDGNGISHPIGLQVSATNVPIANALVRVDEATLMGAAPKFYFKKKFALFFTVQNISGNDVAIYDWAFKAICPVDLVGRKFDAKSMVSLVTPYIPNNIYIVLKPGEKKKFYSGETDFSRCLPQDKDDLLHDPKYFQGLITCASIKGSAAAAKPGQKPGGFQPPAIPPKKPGDDLDPQVDRLIREHNALVQKNENEGAEMLKARIVKITNIVYPAQINLVESKLMKPQEASNAAAPSSPMERATLSFNGRTMEGDGDCMEAAASLTSSDESTLLMLHNLGSSGSFSVNDNFYTNACTDCLGVQLQDITNSKTYIAVSGSVKRTTQVITIDVTMKELTSEEGGSSYKVTGKIICE